ncbi:hypothetical protein pb186bvf_007108 [Paramecium bursaria]
MKQLLKIPKGTQDFLPEYTLARRQLLDKFVKIFQLYGAVEIDTPVFELKSVLTNKYGDDEKLIYDLKDQGGEELALRYDLTVPFARFLNSHGIKKIKRYQIGKVYRRDNPSYQSGRFREFMQCDYDICGQYTKNISDAEIISVLSKCMSETNLKYKIRVNHRQIISEILNQIGITKNHNQITSAIDKVDKIGWDQVKQELLNKGLQVGQTNLLHQYLFENKQCESVHEDDLNQIIEYSKIWNAGDIVIDKSLMRGLDYYNGMILECDIGQGISVAGGGRYDNLINNLNCVGMSIGIDRLINFIKKQNDINVDISIITIGNTQEIIKYAIRVHQKLVDLGIKSQICLNMKWNLDKQIQWSLNEQRTRAIIIGENEAQNNSFNLKNLNTREEVKYKLEEINQIK